MVAVVIIALAAGALGAVAWAVNRHRTTFGAALPAGAAVAAALLAWIITMALGLNDSAETQWIPWIVSIVAGGAAAWSVSVLVGGRRHRAYVQRSTEILQMR